MVQQSLDTADPVLQKSWGPGKLHGSSQGQHLPPSMGTHPLHTQETTLPFPEWPAQVQMIIIGCTGAAANDSLYYSSTQEAQSWARTLLCQVLHKYELMTCGNVYIHKSRDRGIKKTTSFTFSNAARRTWAWPVTSTTTEKRERADLVKPFKQHKHKSTLSWILVHWQFLSCHLFYFHLLLHLELFLSCHQVGSEQSKNKTLLGSAVGTTEPCLHCPGCYKLSHFVCRGWKGTVKQSTWCDFPVPSNSWV